MEIQFADLFTDDAMNRPLFEEPSDACARESPWSGPQGFMIGGMVWPSKTDLSQQYFDAAHLLMESITRCEWEDYKLVNPALFLYRHSLELQVKSILGKSAKTHDLSTLADQLDVLTLSRDGVRAPPWIISRLKEIAAIDPNSTTFRYAVTYDPKTQQDLRVAGEIYVSVPRLKDAMLALFAALTGDLPEIARTTAQ